MTKTYFVNEIFCSLQGEGMRAGTLNVFVRFAGCNLQCRRDNEAGFDCDTEFLSRRPMDADAILQAVQAAWTSNKSLPNVILTGGEPLLQVDDELLGVLMPACEQVCIETNGTRPVPASAEGKVWISCSPKTAEHTLNVLYADEVRYVRHKGQGIPQSLIRCTNLFLSPAFSDDADEVRENLKHCIELIRQHPRWRLSVQQHKLWSVR